MEKPLFNVDDYGKGVCMKFENEDEYDAFSEYLDSIGETWCDNERYVEHSMYHRYGNSTVLYFNDGRYGQLELASRSVQILRYSDFRYEVKTTPQPEPDVSLTFDELVGF